MIQKIFIVLVNVSFLKCHRLRYETGVQGLSSVVLQFPAKENGYLSERALFTEYTDQTTRSSWGILDTGCTVIVSTSNLLVCSKCTTYISRYSNICIPVKGQYVQNTSRPPTISLFADASLIHILIRSRELLSCLVSHPLHLSVCSSQHYYAVSVGSLSIPG